MISVQQIGQRLRNKYRRHAIGRWERRDFTLTAPVASVSFTFDDFPLSALTEGGRILLDYDVRGTYFVSMQLAGQRSVSGPIASRSEIAIALRDGHELGCHTFEHLDGSKVSADAFERSIETNRLALSEFVPDGRVATFAYPLEGPNLGTKRVAGQRFLACRGGGQSFNAGTVDLNLVKAYFLDRKNRHDLPSVRGLIERNAASRGWLIFATHDVRSEPSDYGCEPGYFADVVRWSVESGARVLPMAQACQALGIGAHPATPAAVSVRQAGA